MNAIIATSVLKRESAKELLAAAYERHAATLTAFFADRVDWHLAEDLASEVWTELAGALDVMDRRVLKLDWLLLVARNIVCRRTGDTDPAILTTPSELEEFGSEDRGFDECEDDAPAPAAVASESVTALDFRRSHGDPASWTISDFDAYEHLAETVDVVDTVDVVRLPRTADDAVLEVRAA